MQKAFIKHLKILKSSYPERRFLILRVKHTFFYLVISLKFAACSLFNTDVHNDLVSDIKDCYPDRKTENVITSQSVKITKTGDQFVLVSPEGGERFVACNLPDVSGLEGKELMMDALLKQIFPEERWMGKPCVLSKLVIKNN